MTSGTHALSIQDFLLAHALGPVDEILDRQNAAMPGPNGRLMTRADLREEVERHSDRTMTVVSINKTETLTRCGVCPKEVTRPCMALRLLALPYAQHPAYRPEWRIARPESPEIPPMRRPLP